jgi:hypothetical protein
MAFQAETLKEKQAQEYMADEERCFWEHRAELMQVLKTNLSILANAALAKGFIDFQTKMNILRKSIDFNKEQQASILVNVLLEHIMNPRMMGAPSDIMEKFFKSLDEAGLREMKEYLETQYQMKKKSSEFPEEDVLIQNIDKIPQALHFNLDPVAGKLYQLGALTDAEYRTVMNPHEDHDEAAIRVIMNNIHECIRSRPDENMKKLIEILEDIGGPLTEAAKTMERDLGPSRRF